ncbi:hypothetical protein FOA52_000479 [Chlamydomonas sp. UWO 241]|nr:hypothetical protein FOA52_000479 [Chlamydomonas sp. UWO 241]
MAPPERPPRPGGVPASSLLWVDKHKPRDSQELAGNNALVATLRAWLNQWHDIHIRKQAPKGYPGSGSGKPKDLHKKAILLSGPPGIGKTSAAHIIARECGFAVVETNASDTRNKCDTKIKDGIHGKGANMIKEMVGNETIFSSLAKASPQPRPQQQGTNVHKQILVMDEVDGMSGGDRGGVQDLVDTIKRSKIPIVCICNDKWNQKLKSLRNHCLEMDFRRPTPQQIGKRMQEICAQEGLRVDEATMHALVEGANGDLRLILGQLQMVRLSRTTLSYDDVKNGAQRVAKDADRSPFECAAQLFQPASQHLSMNDRLDMVFADADLVPLLVQENYINHAPMIAGNDEQRMRALAKSSEAISAGDKISTALRKTNNWSLGPAAYIQMAVVPATYMRGRREIFNPGEMNFPRFTAWLRVPTVASHVPRRVPQGRRAVRRRGRRDGVRRGARRREAKQLKKAKHAVAARAAPAQAPEHPPHEDVPLATPTATPAADGPTIDATPIASSVKKKPPSSEAQNSWIKTFPFIFIATAVNSPPTAPVYSLIDLTKHSKCDEHKDAVDAKVKKDGGSGGIVAAAHAGARAHVEVLKGLLPTLLMGALWICTELLPGLKFASLLVALKAGNTSAPPPAKVKFFKGSFKMTTAYKFAANFADAAIESLKERFFDDDPSLDILACFTIFDPVQNIGMGHAELDDFGNDSFQQLKDHFWSGDGLPNSPFSARGESFMATLDTEFKHVKTVIKDRLALTPSATMLNLWRFIARSSDSLMVPNIILLMNVYYVMALHTAEVERGFSIHRILKNRLRSRLMILMVDSLLRIWHLAQSFTGPRESENNSLINEAAEKLSGASLQSQGVNPPSILKRLVEEVSRVQVSFLDRDLDEAARLLEKEGLEDVDPAVAFDVEGNIVEEEDAGEPDELESDEDDFPLIDLKKR